MAYPRFQRARAHRTARRTSGNITLNSNMAWANVDTGLDLTIEAQAGDVLEVSANGLLADETVNVYLDVVSVVGGAPVNSFNTRSAVTAGPPFYGLLSWYCEGGEAEKFGIPFMYPVVAGDLSDGRVTCRLRYTGAVAGNRVLYADGTNWIFQWAVKNLGPADPE